MPGGWRDAVGVSQGGITDVTSALPTAEDHIGLLQGDKAISQESGQSIDEKCDTQRKSNVPERMVTMIDRADSQSGNKVLLRVNVKHTLTTAHTRQASEAKVLWRVSAGKGSGSHSEAGDVMPPISKSWSFDEVTSDVSEEAGAAASAEKFEGIAEDIDVQVSL